MRKIQGFVFSIFFLVGVSSFSNDVIPAQIISMIAQELSVNYATMNFDWKVGDTLNFNFRIKPIPIVASASLQVTAMEKDGDTLTETISYKSFKQVIETVIDPNTGKIKSMKINGKPTKVPEGGDTKVVNEEESHIKVPAGEFDCIHVVTEGAEGNKAEMWINPAVIPISGLLKSSSVAGYATVEMELVSFVQGK